MLVQLGKCKCNHLTNTRNTNSESPLCIKFETDRGQKNYRHSIKSLSNSFCMQQEQIKGDVNVFKD